MDKGKDKKLLPDIIWFYVSTPYLVSSVIVIGYIAISREASTENEVHAIFSLLQIASTFDCSC
jgi:hypothetical protein